MTFHPITIDSSVTNIESSSIRVKEGPYLVKVLKVNPSKEDYEGEPLFRWVLQFTEGPDPTAKGRSITYISTFKEEAHFSLGRIVAAVGVLDHNKLVGMNLPNYQKFVALAASLEKRHAGQPLGIIVADNVYNGKTSSRVIDCFPASEWAQRKVAVGSSAPASNGKAMAAVAAPENDDEFEAAVDDLFN